MPPSEAWSIPGADGEPILGDCHRSDGEPVGVLLCCHGFKGYKDYGFFPRLAASAAKAGLIAHRFNFSHSGMTNRIETFERPDLFERDTWNRQVADLAAVSGAVARGELPGAGLPQAWYGHSRGGVTCVLTAGRRATEGGTSEPGDGGAVEPTGIVAAAAPAGACNLDEDQKAMLRRAGRMASPSSRTGQVLHVGAGWLAEIEADPRRHDPLEMARATRCPVLLIYGTADATVPVADGRAYAEALGDRGRLVTIDGASHTFDAPNPLPADQPPPEATRRMIDETTAFAVERCRAAAGSRPTRGHG